MFPPSFEQGTFRVWGERDNHYTTETDEGVFHASARSIIYRERLKA